VRDRHRDEAARRPRVLVQLPCRIRQTHKKKSSSLALEINTNCMLKPRTRDRNWIWNSA
jgi:hypothetical protein